MKAREKSKIRFAVGEKRNARTHARNRDFSRTEAALRAGISPITSVSRFF